MANPSRILRSIYRDKDSFVEACYQEYLSFFQGQPLLFGKPLQRNLNMHDETNKEVDFWGICNGHNDSKQPDGFARYETITYLRHVVTSCPKSEPKRGMEVIWWEALRNRKKRVMLLCERLRYLVICQRIGAPDDPKFYQFVTAYPIKGQRSLDMRIKEFEEFWLQKNQSRLKHQTAW